MPLMSVCMLVASSKSDVLRFVMGGWVKDVNSLNILNVWRPVFTDKSLQSILP